MPSASAKRTKKLSAPANEAELLQFYSACEKVQMEPADTLRKLARAFAETAEKNGYIVQPMRICAKRGPAGD